MKRPVVQVLVDDTPVPPVLNGALKRVGADIELNALAADPPASNRGPVDARILLTSDARSLLTGKAARVRRWLQQEPAVTLILSDVSVEAGLMPTFLREHHELAIVANLSQDELAGRIRAMCGVGPMLRQYYRRASASELQVDALLAKVEKLDRERQLASALQRELLPHTLPKLREAELVVLYEPADLVAGDLYDVFPLDDEHVGISLLDATGHGVAAALVASFAARRLRSDVQALRPADLLMPDEPLVRMNAALCEAELEECHFVAALFAVYNERTQVVRWARGGSSYPILVPWRSEPRVLRTAGPLVGIGPRASFEVGEVRLRPGDSLFLYTDGMECLPPPSAVTSRGENVTSVDWLERARGGNLRTAMMHLESRIKSGSSTRTRDDITVIALQSHRPVSAPASLMRPAPVEARCEAAYS